MHKKNNASITLKKVILCSILLIFIMGISVLAVNSRLDNVKIILSNNYEMEVVTDKTKVSDILEENHIILLDDEKVTPDINEEITDNQTIRITKIEEVVEFAQEEKNDISVEEILNENYSSITEKIVTEQVEIPFETITKDVSNGGSKQNKVVQEGENGLKEVIYRIKYQNEEEIEKEEISSKILKEPKNKIIEVQTRQVTSRSNTSRTSGGQTISSGTYIVTAYCSCSKCCGKTNGMTASGTKATAGRTVAAPSNFAFGTKLKINGKIYVVEDRGGAIQGNRIDIYMSSHTQALAWGKRTCTVEVVN